jgi:hypothetical protein
MDTTVDALNGYRNINIDSRPVPSMAIGEFVAVLHRKTTPQQ